MLRLNGLSMLGLNLKLGQLSVLLSVCKIVPIPLVRRDEARYYPLSKEKVDWGLPNLVA